MLFLAVGMHSAWRRGKLTVAARPLGWLAAAALLLAFAVQGFGYHEFHPVGLVGLTFGFWIIFSSLIEPVSRWRRRQTLGAAMLGMCLAHLGVGVFAIGASGVESYKIEKDVALKPGGSFKMAGYDFRFVTARDVSGPNYDAVEATVQVSRDGKPVTVLYPQKRRYWVQHSENSQAAISVGWARDLFVAMGNPLGENAWSMRIQYKPFVRYIWLGAIIMALGGLIAATDRRYRVRVAKEASERGGVQPAAGPA
jgi:cytochrome c-type biogenesis protein CcmF